MIVTYFRSSSLGSWNLCPTSYTFDYVLGRRGSTNKSAIKGTCVHFNMELLAKAKKAQQDGQEDFYHEVIGGRVKNHIPDKYIDALTERGFKYYTENSGLNFSKADLADCKRWTKQALALNNGAFDPRKQNILEAEMGFDITIDKPWADYEYDYNGTKISGKLAIRGTIDLLTWESNDIILCTDYKTGRRINWGTGEVKDYAALQKDMQLKLYYYAIKHKYPTKDVMFTIYFIKDGGPFTLCFGPKDILDVENHLKEKFNEIRSCKKPPMSIGQKCTSFCSFGKRTFEGTDIKPEKMTCDGHITPKGQTASMCEQFHQDLNLYGLDKTIEKYRVPHFNPSFYKAPGSLE